jgi:hypothetical protein
MNQKCVTVIEKLHDTFGELADALENLKAGVEQEDEEQIDQALDMFPRPKQLESALEKLGSLIEGHPWETRKKNAR